MKSSFNRFAVFSILAFFGLSAAFAAPPSSGINVKANVATTASTSGFGSSFSSMSITGVTSARTANTRSATDMKAANTWTSVGYSVKDGEASGTFSGVLDASAFVTRVSGTDHCDPISLSADANSHVAANMQGISGQGGFSFIESIGEVKGSVTRSRADGVSTLTAKVDVLTGKTTSLGQTVTVDGVVLAAPTLHTSTGGAAASFLLDTPVFSSHDED